MYDEKLVKQLVKKLQQYRRLQARRLKLNTAGMKNPQKANNPKMFAILANMGALLKEMDELAKQLEAQEKASKRELPGLANHYVN